MKPENYYTIKDIATALEVSPGTVRLLFKDAPCEYYKPKSNVPRALIYHRDVVLPICTAYKRDKAIKKGWIKIADAAQKYGVSFNCLYIHAKRGNIEHKKTGRRILLNEKSIKEKFALLSSPIKEARTSLNKATYLLNMLKSALQADSANPLEIDMDSRDNMSKYREKLIETLNAINI